MCELTHLWRLSDLCTTPKARKRPKLRLHQTHPRPAIPPVHTGGCPISSVSREPAPDDRHYLPLDEKVDVPALPRCWRRHGARSSRPDPTRILAAGLSTIVHGPGPNSSKSRPASATPRSPLAPGTPPTIPPVVQTAEPTRFPATPSRHGRRKHILSHQLQEAEASLRGQLMDQAEEDRVRQYQDAVERAQQSLHQATSWPSPSTTTALSAFSMPEGTTERSLLHQRPTTCLVRHIHCVHGCRSWSPRCLCLSTLVTQLTPHNMSKNGGLTSRSANLPKIVNLKTSTNQPTTQPGHLKQPKTPNSTSTRQTPFSLPPPKSRPHLPLLLPTPGQVTENEARRDGRPNHKRAALTWSSGPGMCSCRESSLEESRQIPLAGTPLRNVISRSMASVPSSRAFPVGPVHVRSRSAAAPENLPTRILTQLVPPDASTTSVTVATRQKDPTTTSTTFIEGSATPCSSPYRCLTNSRCQSDAFTTF